MQVQYNCMTEDHSSLLDSLESAEEARSDLEQTISGLKVQTARSKRERMYVPLPQPCSSPLHCSLSRHTKQSLHRAVYSRH